jgi:hypothetical protein
MAEKKREKRGIKHGTDTKLKPVRWEYDILIKDFIPRQYPREVPPTGIFDETLYCLRFNELWLPHILGALQLLLEKDSWSGGDAEIFRAQQAIYTMLANIEEPCGSGELRFPEFRSIPVSALCDQPQWKYIDEPDTAWRDFGTTICDGADGDDGAPGGQGPIGPEGPPGADCECPPVPTEPPIEPETADNACAGAFGVVEKLLSILNYNLDTLEFAGTVTEGVVDQVTLNLTNTLEALPIIGNVIAGLKLALAAGIGATRAAINNPDFQDDVACLLYCEVEEEGAFNQNSFNAWVANLESDYPGLNYAPFIDLVKNIVGYATLARRFAIESLNVDSRCASLCDCATCSEALIHDFVQNPVTDDFGWSLFNTGAPSAWNCGDVDFSGTAFAGARTINGWVVNNTPESMAITRNWPEGFTLCKANIPIVNSTGNTNTRVSALWIKRLDTGVWESLQCKLIPFPTSGSATLTWEDNAIEISDMLAICEVGGGTMTIQRVELNYTP